MRTAMTLLPSRHRSLMAVIVVFLACPIARTDEERTGWKPDAAGKYLDEREKVWFGSAKCVSCHTSLPYALGRPALHKLVGAKKPSEQEAKLLAQIRLRVANWKRLDTKEFGLYYDGSDEMKSNPGARKQSSTRSFSPSTTVIRAGLCQARRRNRRSRTSGRHRYKPGTTGGRGIGSISTR